MQATYLSCSLSYVRHILPLVYPRNIKSITGCIQVRNHYQQNSGWFLQKTAYALVFSTIPSTHFNNACTLFFTYLLSLFSLSLTYTYTYFFFIPPPLFTTVILQCTQRLDLESIRFCLPSCDVKHIFFPQPCSYLCPSIFFLHFSSCFFSQYFTLEMRMTKLEYTFSITHALLC